MTKFHVNDAVVLKEALPQHGLGKGAVGTVVHEFLRPVRAYEVEFCDAEGRTIVELPLKPGQIAPYRETDAPGDRLRA